MIVDLAADYVAGDLRPADDATDARWFSWSEVAAAADVVPSTRDLVRAMLTQNK